VANRQLTKQELETLAYPLLSEVRGCLEKLSAGDKELLWALRRKIAKELVYDERSKPSKRGALKKKKRKEQNNLCAKCGGPLPETGSVLDRLVAMNHYTVENTRLLCPDCDGEIQKERKFT
jgi:hypothetical protein